MMNRKLTFVLLLSAIMTALNFYGAYAKNKNTVSISFVALTEEQKITKLIEYVRSLKGASFIRNGSEHTPEEAAEHLTLKRKKAGSRVKTAADFIVYCGSKSSMSGKDYMIKLADGKTVKSMDLLVEQLKKINAENK